MYQTVDRDGYLVILEQSQLPIAAAAQDLRQGAQRLCGMEMFADKPRMVA
jgi:hypothetical protein